MTGGQHEPRLDHRARADEAPAARLLEEQLAVGPVRVLEARVGRYQTGAAEIGPRGADVQRLKDVRHDVLRRFGTFVLLRLHHGRRHFLGLLLGRDIGGDHRQRAARKQAVIGFRRHVGRLGHVLPVDLRSARRGGDRDRRRELSSLDGRFGDLPCLVEELVLVHGRLGQRQRVRVDERVGRPVAGGIPRDDVLDLGVLDRDVVLGERLHGGQVPGEQRRGGGAGQPST